MIVPIALPSTPRMSPLRKLLSKKGASTWCSNFADRPGALFSGVHQKVSIVLSYNSIESATSKLYTAAYRHWYSQAGIDERSSLLQTLAYVVPLYTSYCWLKSGDTVENSIFQKIRQQTVPISSNFRGKPEFALNMRMMYWPKCFERHQTSNEYKHFKAEDDLAKRILIATFNSTLYFWFWELVSDGWHITSKELENFFFSIDLMSAQNKQCLADLCDALMEDLENKKAFVGTKQTEYEYYHRLSKPIIDDIDSVLAKHYGFTEEELDFIINYDIKYRMGKDIEEE
jgi:hypothetical protein